MAKVKVTNIKNVQRSISKDVNRAAVNGVVKDRVLIENEIIATILSGTSPVKGKSFKQYSKNYADRAKGGNRKPVNMMVTGDMLDSLQVKRSGKSISIAFKSKIAVFHDKLGAGLSKVIRRLLPDSSKGETFKSNINDVIKRAVDRGISMLK